MCNSNRQKRNWIDIFGGKTDASNIAIPLKSAHDMSSEIICGLLVHVSEGINRKNDRRWGGDVFNGRPTSIRQ